MSRCRLLLLGFLVCMVSVCSFAQAEQATFVLTAKGLEIHAGTAGNFSLGAPTFEEAKSPKPTEITLSADGSSLDLKYNGGATGKIHLDSDKAVTVSFAALPVEMRKCRFQMYIPIEYSDGGKYAIGGGDLQAFPQDKPAKPFLYQGNAQSLSIVHASGVGFTLAGFPQGDFQQLQDNREWNWGIFSWFVAIQLGDADAPSFTLTLDTPAGGTNTPKILIDRYGQHADKDFPEKVKSDDDLKQDVAKDAAYFGALNPPTTDSFGGLPDSGTKFGLKKTGFFHVEKSAGGAAQVLVDPDGNAFFQLGVCGIVPCDDFTTVRGREKIYEWLPPTDDPTFATAWKSNDPGVVSFYLANLIRKYGEPFSSGAYTQRWIDHLRKWGYNSAGAFAFDGNADEQAAVHQSNFPYVTFLPMSGLDSLPVKGIWDPFADGVEAKLDTAMGNGLARNLDDPLLIGYFLCNEPLIEDLTQAVPALKGSKYAAKRRLVQLLQEEYPTIDALNTAWETKAASFDDLKDTPLVVTTKTASEDMQKYFQLFLEARYSLVSKYFHKYDSNHLLIGDRWMPGTANNETLVRTAAKYYDIISVNYYTYGMDKDFINRIHTWAGNKPLILSEFYYSARDQGMSGGTQVSNQTERGLAYRNYVEQAASTGYVVGIEWFFSHDQAATGRFFEGFSGECANTGLVNVADRPYKDFLTEAMKANYDIYSVIFQQRPPFLYDDPRFTMKPGGHKMAQIARMRQPNLMNGQRAEWPGVPPTRIGPECMVMGENSKDFEAAYWAAWDDTNLYLYVEITDPTPMQNNLKDEAIWAGDGVELFTGFDEPDQGGNMRFCDRQVLIRGAKTDATHSAMAFFNAPKKSYDGKSVVIPGADGKSYTIEASIPFEALGFTPKAGQEILFDLAVDDGGNGRRMLAWNGTARDSRDRASWGRATFGN